MSTNGRLHPITIAIREIADIFGRMGFGIAYGPELEDEFHNFDGLRMYADHPARDMQDTFFTNEKPQRVLRTHCTSVTLRCLEKLAKEGGTRMRMVSPGKVFRNEATDMTHEAQFYHYDGFAVGPSGEITLAHLKYVFTQFYRESLGPEVKIRFRPSYFPFVEPGVEVDAWFETSGEEGKWLEMAGAGMIHPEVLHNVHLDPEKIQGIAWGGGLERLIMVKYGIPDVRFFHSGDVRFNYAFEEKSL